MRRFVWASGAIRSRARFTNWESTAPRKTDPARQGTQRSIPDELFYRRDVGSFDPLEGRAYPVLAEREIFLQPVDQHVGDLDFATDANGIVRQRELDGSDIVDRHAFSGSECNASRRDIDEA